MVGGLRFLLDTNVWLELLLNQENADQVRQFLQAHDSWDFAMTEFSLYSIAVILTRLKKDQALLDFLADTLQDSDVHVIRLDTSGLRNALEIRGQFGLDFDDAYQYTAAERNGLILVSFDSDFDSTPRGRTTPSQAMQA